MEIIDSNSIKTEISTVTPETGNGKCDISWKTADGGAILCLSPGFYELPTIDLLSKLNASQLELLFSGSDLKIVLDDNAHTPAWLIYKNENMVNALGGKVSVSAGGNFCLPLKVQVWCVSNDQQTVYRPINGQNIAVAKADVKVTIETTGFIKKVKKISFSMRNAEKCADGFLCYTVEGGPTDADGFPMEYPIPKAKVSSGFEMPADMNIKIGVAHKWADLVRVTGGK